MVNLVLYVKCWGEGINVGVWGITFSVHILKKLRLVGAGQSLSAFFPLTTNELNFISKKKKTMN
jgi:hypothetical protein